MYSEIVKQHFANPRHVGELDAPDATGTAKNIADGDQVQLHLKLEAGVIKDVRMKVMGCVAAIAATSCLTEMIDGKSVREALDVTKESLVEALGGLPENKVKCSLTCIDALQDALADRQ